MQQRCSSLSSERAITFGSRWYRAYRVRDKNFDNLCDERTNDEIGPFFREEFNTMLTDDDKIESVTFGSNESKLKE